jgi:molecular chaperone GrpE
VAPENEKNAPVDTVCDDARAEKMSELEILQQSLEDKKKLADEYYNQLLRLRAEFENFRRRSDKEKQDHVAWGKEGILMKQVSLMDVLDQALVSSRVSPNIESIIKGIELIRLEFARILVSEGVTEIEALGKPFDPAQHDAIDHVDSDADDGTVLAVLQKGYRMNGRVIRPARVQVARKTAETAKTPETPETLTEQ